MKSECQLGRETRRVRGAALDLVVPAVFAAIVCLCAPLRTALEFGNDEGYELMKAFLVSLGYPLYSRVWNDQPPLHTEALALLFRIFGPSAFGGRLLTVGLSSIVTWSLFKIVAKTFGKVGGLLAVALMVSSSYFLDLSVSVMIELPAVALALFAVWAWTEYFAGGGRSWLVVSGICFGCALQVKLTAAMFIPALVCDYLANRVWNSTGNDRLNRRSSTTNTLLCRPLEILVWSCTLLGAFALIVAIWYRPDSMRVFRSSHFSSGTRLGALFEGHLFDWKALASQVQLITPAVAGLLFAALKGQRELVIPTALLATALAVHSWHRPYWYYYVLHFSIPMAWLGGAGVIGWIKIISANGIPPATWNKVRAGLSYMLWSIVVASIILIVPENIWNDLSTLRNATLAKDERLVLALRKRAKETHWVVTDRVIYAFWAGLPVPPELAVIPSKRVWSGQLSTSEVLACFERYQPEQVLFLSGWGNRPDIEAYVRAHYEANSYDQRVYVRKE